MKLKFIPNLSLKARNIYEHLPKNRQVDVLCLAQFLPELVERKLATLVNNTKEPFEYRFHWKKKGIKIQFKLSKQTQTPLIIDLSVQ